MLPERTCCVCRTKCAKTELLRIVKNKDGKIGLDLMQNKDGRGFYVCNKEECKTRFLEKKIISKVLKQNVEPSLYEELKIEFDAIKKQS